MSSVVMLHKFNFNLTYVALESPSECTIYGSVLARDEDNALERIEDTYSTMAHRLRCIRVQRVFDDEEVDDNTTARYHFDSKPVKAAEEKQPPFQLQDVEGLTEYYDYLEVDVKPFTYKEKSNEQ